MRASGEAYRTYQRLLAEYDYLDFSTIQVEMLRLLEEPDVCAQIQSRFDYLMIDEYQDTNTIQERIVLKLAEGHKNLCVVGDDDQALYRFRGASIRHILEFPLRYPRHPLPDRRLRAIAVRDKLERRDGTFSKAEFRYAPAVDAYTRPAGKTLKTYWRQMKTPRDGVSKDGFRRYYARQADCAACALKESCCPNQPGRKIARHVHEAARDAARRIVTTDAYADASRRRKNVEMLFAHLKRILRLDRLRLRGPNGARDEFLLAATAQNLRKLAKLIPGTPAPA